MSTTPQRMSKERLAKLESRTMKGYDSYELVQALKVERAIVERVENLMQQKRDTDWATCNGELPIDLRDFFVELESAIHPAPEQSK